MRSKSTRRQSHSGAGVAAAPLLTRDDDWNWERRLRAAKLALSMPNPHEYAAVLTHSSPTAPLPLAYRAWVAVWGLV